MHGSFRCSYCVHISSKEFINLAILDDPLNFIFQALEFLRVMPIVFVKVTIPILIPIVILLARDRWKIQSVLMARHVELPP